MLHRAYNYYLESSIGPHELMNVWIDGVREKVPTFRFWITCKSFLSLYFRLIQVQREGNLHKTKLTIIECCPWFFAFDRSNYKSWTVFNRDIVMLPITHPTVDRAFNKGLFCILRGRAQFSLMALAQNMEHYTSSLSRLQGIQRSLWKSRKKKPVDDEWAINPFMITSLDSVTLDTGEVVDPLLAQYVRMWAERRDSLPSIHWGKIKNVWKPSLIPSLALVFTPPIIAHQKR